VKKTRRLGDERIFRYWVEVRDLASGSVRKLPLTAWRLVCLKRGKKNEPPLPDREVLKLQVDEETWEAESFEELRTRLRDKYPDAAFERTLHFVRDHEAEERRETALNGLIRILAKAAVDNFIAGKSPVDTQPEDQRGQKRRRTKSRTQVTCASVSGTVTPRARLKIPKAESGSTPKALSKHAHMSPDRPIPARQWTATARPDRSCASSGVSSVERFAKLLGTPRSGMGNEMNCRAAAKQRDSS
jgi:hypothetical protein